MTVLIGERCGGYGLDPALNTEAFGRTPDAHFGIGCGMMHRQLVGVASERNFRGLTLPSRAAAAACRVFWYCTVVGDFSPAKRAG